MLLLLLQNLFPPPFTFIRALHAFGDKNSKLSSNMLGLANILSHIVETKNRINLRRWHVGIFDYVTCVEEQAISLTCPKLDVY